ncbi:unnamed protein product [Boreogadus saida]
MDVGRTFTNVGDSEWSQSLCLAVRSAPATPATAVVITGGGNGMERPPFAHPFCRVRRRLQRDFEDATPPRVSGPQTGACHLPARRQSGGMRPASLG